MRREKDSWIWTLSITLLIPFSLLIGKCANARIWVGQRRMNPHPLTHPPLIKKLIVCRKLEEVGQQYGSSAVVCHIHMLANGSYVLNVANTGLGEAILCRNGRAVPLTTPHSPTTNIKERARIADARGFISQVNLMLYSGTTLFQPLK